MTYLVIGDDPAGTVAVHDGAPTIGRIERLVGEMGYGKLYPDRAYRMVGWASDVGLLMTQRFARNPVAACVLGALGANPQPVGGPVVFTGYAFDEGGWPDPLGADALVSFEQVYRAVRDALGNPADELPQLSGRPVGAMHAPPEWAQRIRAFAADVTGGPIPPITFGPPR